VTDRAYYADRIGIFVTAQSDAVLGALARNASFALEPSQRDAISEADRLRKRENPG
jgi:hypothetical protein